MFCKLINKHLLQQDLALQGEAIELEVEAALGTSPSSGTSVIAFEPCRGWSVDIFNVVSGLLLGFLSLGHLQGEVSWLE